MRTWLQLIGEKTSDLCFRKQPPFGVAKCSAGFEIHWLALEEFILDEQNMGISEITGCPHTENLPQSSLAGSQLPILCQGRRIHAVVFGFLVSVARQQRNWPELLSGRLV